MDRSVVRERRAVGVRDSRGPLVLLTRAARPRCHGLEYGHVQRPAGQAARFGVEIGTGKTHISIALGVRACLAGQRVQFATATQWVARLADAKRTGGLEAEIKQLAQIPLVVVDEVGYIPFDPEAANLMFELVSARYERASMIVTSNKPFSKWGEIFGDDMVATAMIDRLIHHADILSLKGDCYRLRGKDIGPRPTPVPDPA